VFGADDEALKIVWIHVFGAERQSRQVYFPLQTKRVMGMKRIGCLAVFILTACSTQAPVPVMTPPPVPAAAPAAEAMSCPVVPACSVPRPDQSAPEQPPAPAYVPVGWDALPQWRNDRIEDAWPGLIASCKAMRAPTIKAAWQEVCDAARALGDKPGAEAMRSFIEARLQALELDNADGTKEGLITGYYEPLIQGSRWKSGS
jgi:membrane-bound lytic murein transglycosylase A